MADVTDEDGRVVANDRIDCTGVEVVLEEGTPEGQPYVDLIDAATGQPVRVTVVDGELTTGDVPEPEGAP